MSRTDTDKILEDMRKMLSEGGMEEIRTVPADESPEGVTVLTTLHRGFGTVSGMAEGRFFFLMKNEEPAFFVSKIIFLREVDTDSLPGLLYLAGALNGELPAGCFEYDIYDDSLSFTWKIPVHKDLSEKELCVLSDSCMATSLSLSEQYAEQLIITAARGGGI